MLIVANLTFITTGASHSNHNVSRNKALDSLQRDVLSSLPQGSPAPERNITRT